MSLLNRLGVIAHQNYMASNTVDVKTFGATGDGVTDDTLSVQACIDSAAINNEVVLFSEGIYSVSQARIKDGCLGYQGINATIKANSNVGEAVLSTEFTTIDDYFVDGLILDANSVSRRGLFARSSRTRITNNTIKGMDNPSVSDQAMRFFYDSSDNIIQGNTIDLGEDAPFATYSALGGIMFSGNTNGNYAGLDTNDEVIPATNKCLRNVITRNTINNGTHGIFLQGAEYNEVYDNDCIGQSHRNIILSPLASYNEITNNRCTDCGESGIHLAYGSSNNLIDNNNIYSDKHYGGTIRGEGGLQVYVHCDDNTFTNNEVYVKYCRYAFYSAIGTNGLIVQNNTLEGGDEAVVGIESDWVPVADMDPLELYAKDSYGLYPNTSWTSWDSINRGMHGIDISYNNITQLNDGVAHASVYVGQSLAAEFDILEIDNNTIKSQPTVGHAIYEYVNSAGAYTNVVITNNTLSTFDVTLKMADYGTITTDRAANTTIFKAGLAASASQGIPIELVTAETYQLNYVDLDAYGGAEVVGNGAITDFLSTSSISNAFEVKVTTPRVAITFRNFKIMSTNDQTNADDMYTGINLSNVIGFHGAGVDGLVLEDMTYENLLYPIKIDSGSGTSRNFNINIDNMTTVNCVWGMYASYTSILTMDDSTLDIPISRDKRIHGVYLAADCSDMTFTNVEVTNAYGSAWQLYNSSSLPAHDITFNNCSADNVRDGIIAYSDCYDITVNTFTIVNSGIVFFFNGALRFEAYDVTASLMDKTNHVGLVGALMHIEDTTDCIVERFDADVAGTSEDLCNNNGGNTDFEATNWSITSMTAYDVFSSTTGIIQTNVVTDA